MVNRFAKRPTVKRFTLGKGAVAGRTVKKTVVTRRDIKSLATRKGRPLRPMRATRRRR